MKKIFEIIRDARGNLSQAEFAQKLGRSQPVLSKYERGTINPPAEVVEKCIEILEQRNEDDISIDMLIKRLNKEVSGERYKGVRRAIKLLLDGAQI